MNEIAQAIIYYCTTGDTRDQYREPEVIHMAHITSFTVDDRGVTVIGKRGGVRSKRFIPMHNIMEIYYE